MVIEVGYITVRSLSDKADEMEHSLHEVAKQVHLKSSKPSV